MEYQDSNDDSVLNDSDRLIHNEEILDFVLQCDLPIFLSIDTSLQNRAAVSSVSLITTGQVCINMAEVLFRKCSHAAKKYKK